MSGESYTRWRCAASDEEDEGEEGEGVGVSAASPARVSLTGGQQQGAVTIVTNPSRPQTLTPAAQTRVALVMVLACVACAVAGVWVGREWGERPPPHWPINLIVPAPKNDYNHSQRLLNNLNPPMIKEYMRRVWQAPPRLLDTLVEGAWRQQGYETSTTTFTVNVSRPDPERPSTVKVLYMNGTELLLNPSLTGLDTLPFAAYSPAGVASGRVVYGHYGRREDLSILQSRGVELRGCVVLMRRGLITTGAKVRNAGQAGVAGVLVYPDPADMQGEEYPEGPRLPGDGLVWESLATTPGDPATPTSPSIQHVYRTSAAEDRSLPQVPTQPVSADEARAILQLIKGPEVPEGWTGGLAAPYTLGGSWGDDGVKNITVSVNNIVEAKEVKNIHATIPASDETRVVMVGCHYGSLEGAGKGAAGLGAMLALSDALAKSQLPRGTQRKVVFSAWAKGDDGSLGSTEFTQLYSWWLESSVVAYLGVDDLLKGTGGLSVAASPALREAVREAALQVTWPAMEEGGPRVSVRDGWRLTDTVPRDDVHFDNIGGSSDAVSFTAQRGVPAATFTAVAPGKDKSYALQHSQYDSFEAYMTLLDPTLAWTHMTASLVGATLLVLSESEVPPLLLSELAGDLYNAWEQFISLHTDTLTHSGYNFTGVLGAIEGEVLRLVDTLTVLDAWYRARPFYVRPYPQHYPGEDHRRQVEQRLWWLANLEKGLMGPRGLERQFTTHLMLGPDPENPAKALYFPHVSAAITRALKQSSPWQTVHQELSYVLAALASYRQLFPSDVSGEAGYHV